MSELKAGVLVTPHNEGMSFHRGSDVIGVTESETEFYLKSEADKVIEKLERDIVKFKSSLKYLVVRGILDGPVKKAAEDLLKEE